MKRWQAAIEGASSLLPLGDCTYLKFHDLRTQEVDWRAVDLQKTFACFAVADGGSRLLSAEDLNRLNLREREIRWKEGERRKRGR